MRYFTNPAEAKLEKDRELGSDRSSVVSGILLAILLDFHLGFPVGLFASLIRWLDGSASDLGWVLA